MTLAQVEHLLAADVAAHKQDFDIAKQIADVELTERVSQTTLAQLDTQFATSPLTSRQLRVLADRSQFLDLPASESVADPAPEDTAQARMLRNAQVYVSETLRRLPNFLATRTINLYDDTPQALKQGDWATRSGLHFVGASNAEISVAREREDQPPEQGSAVWQSRTGLLSGGEFGTTLGMILTDTAKGKIEWSHWERTPTGLLAVFRYSVPASASHFELVSSFQREASVEGVRGPANGRGVSGIGVRPNVSSGNIEVVRTRPAYVGSIWLNPASGAIYRITMEADKSKGPQFRRAAMLVEYGPVDISGSQFICPVRSLALSETVATAESYTGNAATMWLNETLFTDYHRFASSSRIVEEAASNPAPATPLAGEQKPAESSAQPAQPSNEPIAPGKVVDGGAAASIEGKTEPITQPPPNPPPTDPQVPANNPPAREAPPASAPPSNDSPTPGSGLPGSVQPSATAPKEFSIRVEVNSLLVPVVVLDKNGHSLAGLSRENFTVEDDGKARKIVGFTVEKNAHKAGVGNLYAGHGSATDGNTQSLPDKTNASATPATRHVIFLFDDRHMTTSELPLVQRAATHLLEKPLAETDDAAVLSFAGVNSGLTRDRTVLQSAIMKLVVHPMFQRAKEDCPDVDYYSADQIVNKHNAMEFQIAVQKARQCSMSQDIVQSSSNLYSGMDNATNPFQLAAMAAARHAVVVGEEDARQSLLAVRNIVEVMSKMPGQHNLILVSPGFLTLSPETMSLKSEIMDMAAASDVMVNTLDARGLYAGNLDASEGGSTSTLGLISGQQDHLDSMQANENVMSELALGTGGTFFHNNNDLQGGMDALSAAPENLYLIEVSLKDVKANGAYHRLRVKVDQPGVEVLARKGFVAPKSSRGTK
jgi:VWFA-related protein